MPTPAPRQAQLRCRPYLLQTAVSSTVITFLVAALLVFWALGAYNRLMRLRAQVVRSLQALAQQWQSQVQAIGLRLEQYAQGRETESQWASLDDDAVRWRPLTLAARQFLACLAVLQAKPQQMAALDDASSVRAARDIFEAAWQRLQTAQDDLAGAHVPDDLQALWAQQEPVVMEKLREYDQAVQAYHQAIGQFPALLLAWLFGFGMTAKLSS
jgi:LemA protein